MNRGILFLSFILLLPFASTNAWACSEYYWQIIGHGDKIEIAPDGTKTITPCARYTGHLDGRCLKGEELPEALAIVRARKIAEGKPFHEYPQPFPDNRPPERMDTLPPPGGYYAFCDSSGPKCDKIGAACSTLNPSTEKRTVCTKQAAISSYSVHGHDWVYSGDDQNKPVSIILSLNSPSDQDALTVQTRNIKGVYTDGQYGGCFCEDSGERGEYTNESSTPYQASVKAVWHLSGVGGTLEPLDSAGTRVRFTPEKGATGVAQIWATVDDIENSSMQCDVRDDDDAPENTEVKKVTVAQIITDQNGEFSFDPTNLNETFDELSKRMQTLDESWKKRFELMVKPVILDTLSSEYTKLLKARLKVGKSQSSFPNEELVLNIIGCANKAGVQAIRASSDFLEVDWLAAATAPKNFSVMIECLKDISGNKSAVAHIGVLLGSFTSVLGNLEKGFNSVLSEIEHTKNQIEKLKQIRDALRAERLKNPSVSMLIDVLPKKGSQNFVASIQSNFRSGEDKSSLFFLTQDARSQFESCNRMFNVSHRQGEGQPIFEDSVTNEVNSYALNISGVGNLGNGKVIVDFFGPKEDSTGHIKRDLISIKSKGSDLAAIFALSYALEASFTQMIDEYQKHLNEFAGILNSILNGFEKLLDFFNDFGKSDSSALGIAKKLKSNVNQIKLILIQIRIAIGVGVNAVAGIEHYKNSISSASLRKKLWEQYPSPLVKCDSPSRYLLEKINTNVDSWTLGGP